MTKTAAAAETAAVVTRKPARVQQAMPIRFKKHLPAIILFAGVLVWRLFQVRNLALPPWVDSVHHALLVRILLEQGGIPDNWGPYLPQVDFYYHFGFHLSAAVIARLTGISVGQAVLITGQLWQTLLVIAVYLLGYVLWKNPAKAWVAALLVGFVSQMPAYYTTWGRYTLLAGVTLTIAGMAAALAHRKYLLAFLVAATAITHVYALYLLTLFLLGLAVIHVDQRRNVAIGWGLGIALALPWLWRVAERVFQQQMVYVQTGAGSVGYAPDYILYLLGPARNYILLALAGVGLAVILKKLVAGRLPYTAGIVAFLPWTLVVVISMGPWRFGPFRPDHHATIVLFLPVVLLATETLWLVRRRAIRWGALMVLLVWGVWDTANIVNPQTILANSDDVAALEWIAGNTPQNAKFLIDVAPWSAQWRGADGGWWITPLTGRPTVLPPAAYGWGPAESVEKIRATSAKIYELQWYTGPDYCSKLAAMMVATDASHVYTRSNKVAACSDFSLIFQGGDHIGIYKFTPVVPGQTG